MFTAFKTLVGTEYRQAFWSNIYQRVMLLEIEDEIMEEEGEEHYTLNLSGFETEEEATPYTTSSDVCD